MLTDLFLSWILHAYFCNVLCSLLYNITGVFAVIIMSGTIKSWGMTCNHVFNSSMHMEFCWDLIRIGMGVWMWTQSVWIQMYSLKKHHWNWICILLVDKQSNRSSFIRGLWIYQQKTQRHKPTPCKKANYTTTSSWVLDHKFLKEFFSFVKNRHSRIQNWFEKWC